MHSLKKKIISGLLICSLVMPNYIPSYAEGGATIETNEVSISNPEYESYLNNPKMYTNGYIPPETLFPVSQTQSYTRFRSATTVPQMYDARNRGIISPVKDQKITGSCWAFSSITGVEINNLSAGTYYVRYRESDNYKASGYATITLENPKDIRYLLLQT